MRTRRECGVMTTALADTDRFVADQLLNGRSLEFTRLVCSLIDDGGST